MSERTTPPSKPGRSEQVRFEAALHRGERQAELKEIATLDLDRLPGPPEEVRVLLTIDEAARLVQRGFEVHLLKAHPVQPLDGALVATDDAVEQWLEERVQGIERQGGS